MGDTTMDMERAELYRSLPDVQDRDELKWLGFEGSVDFLNGSGLLGEINRRMLHPLGLHLEAKPMDDGCYYMDVGISDTPQGVLYDQKSLAVVIKRHKEFMKDAMDALAARRQTLGYAVQGVGAPRKGRQGRKV